MSFGFKELILIIFIILIMFGAGKLPSVMRDIGKGLKSFKKGYAEEENDDKKL
jgi:sec-independent protein translocase protein TatA